MMQFIISTSSLKISLNHVCRTLKPGKKYQLATNDEINFAMAERFIFDEHVSQKTLVSDENAKLFHQHKPGSLVGKILEDKYELLKIVGEGGTFTVYLAIDKRINKQWAVKVCNKNNKNPIIIDMALQEVNMVKKLDHPAIPKIVDYIEDTEHIYVVQEYVQGETLEQLVSLYGPQPVEQVIEWGKQICHVMSYLHNLNPPHIYRDVKPANLILMPNGQLKIVDYGIMRLYKQGATADEICLGTRGYAAPEQFGGKGQTDARTDIYGIGATLYRLLTGVNLCEEPILKPLSEVKSDLPLRLEYIIKKCTEIDRNNRYQSCDELLYDLNNVDFVERKSEERVLNKSIELIDEFIGKKISNKYTILKLIEQYGLFKRYFAIDDKYNKQWVVKVYDKHHIRYSTVCRDSILREVHMMMKFNHPAILNVADIVEDEHRICIICEYIEGTTLNTIIEENGPVSEETAIEWAKQLCDVLSYLHKQNPPYIYRDMKPANVILQPVGNVKLLDMGTVTMYDVLQELDASCFLGTKGYTAPEGYHGKTDPRSDIYALGMTLHHLVTGVDPKKPPYEAMPIRSINPNLSNELEAIIIRCTQLNPAERYQTCDELMIALQGGPIYPPKKKGFFDKLFGGKSSKPRVNPKVQKIYNDIDKEYREKVFYGSLFSADNILTSLTRDVFGTVNDMNIDICFQIYLQTWIRSRGGVNPLFSTSTYIKQVLCERFSNVNSDVVSKCVTHSLGEIYRREPLLKQRAEAIEEVQKNVWDNAQKNKDIEDKYINDPEYGLVLEKPVFVNGFGSDKEYLSHLHTEDGKKLTFARVGSSEVEGIVGPIDLYRLLLPDGTEYLRVFICNYGLSVKKNAPKGTKYID